ncbi:cytochrome P450 [Clavulina sp. PMI_390]|nr:cytochrome P450 [Clavulina sp. PMI_390]
MSYNWSAITYASLFGLTAVLVLARRTRQLREQERYDIHKLDCPPNPHWLWGHEKEAVYDRNCPEAWNEWAERLGQPAYADASAKDNRIESRKDGEANIGKGVYRIKAALWHDDILVPTDSLAIAHIVSRNVYSNKYSKSPAFRPLIERVIGRSIVWAEGEEHRRMAKVLAGCFTGERVRGMIDVVGECSEKLSEKLRSRLAAGASSESAKEGKLMNLIGWPSGATLDIIGRIGFDHDFQCGESAEAKDMSRLWNKHSEMGMSFTGFMSTVVLRALPIINDFLPEKVKKAQEATKLSVRKLAANLAREELTSTSAENVQREGLKNDRDQDNLLSYLIRASKRDGKEVNIDELFDHISTFIISGHETSSGIIAHTLHALTANRPAQEILRAELTSAGFVPGSGKLRMPTYDELMGNSLPYLDAVAKEGLRMFVPPAQTERVALEDDVVPLGTPIIGADGKALESLRVKKGQMFLISWASINTNAQRWLASEQPTPRATLGGWQHLGTFSEGPRICLGYRLAVLEIKALLLTLVRDFEFIAVEKVPVVRKGIDSVERADGKHEDAEMMDVKIQRRFGGMVHPFIEDGEKAGMPGIWLPVTVRALSASEV